jgi:TPR repeat protein
MVDDADDLWRMLADLDEAGNVAGALDHALGSELKDDSRGQRYIGWAHYTQGEVVTAASWYLKAARQGNEAAIADCMECAIQMWREGRRDEALALAESPPLSHVETSQRFLMSRYFDLGDREKLVEWSLRLAAFGKEGDVMYVAKLLVSQNDTTAALPHLEALAERGIPAAHQLLGELYRQGIGVAKDEQKANLHYAVGARHGYLVSQTRLLHYHRATKGVWYLPVFAVRLLALMIRGVAVNSKHPQDPRLADLPPCTRRQSPIFGG